MYLKLKYKYTKSLIISKYSYKLQSIAYKMKLLLGTEWCALSKKTVLKVPIAE